MPGIMPVIEGDHVHWHPVVTIEKYSPDQTAYAEKLMRQALGWRRLPVIRGLVPARAIHGDWLREIFPSGPEDGITRDEGNLLVNTGLTVLVKLLTGAGASSYYPLSANTSQTAGNSIVGVGTNSSGAGAAAAVTDTALHDDNTANCMYQGSDSTYPNTSTGTGLITNQSTFASGSGNFAWNEWCWATCNAAIAPGTHLSAVGTSVNMLNHKVNLSSGGGASLGSKGSGATWVFATTVQFS